MAEKLKEDLFTVNDATFNRTIEEVNSEVGRAIVEQTNIVKKQSDYLGLEYKEPPQEDEEGGFGSEGGFDEGFGGGFEEEGGAEDAGPPAQESVEGDGSGEEGSPAGGNGSAALVDALAEHLPADASDEEISDVVEKVTAET